VTSNPILSGSDRFVEGKPFKLTCTLFNSTTSSVKYFTVNSGLTDADDLLGTVRVNADKCFNEGNISVECVSTSCSCSGIISGNASSFTWVITPDRIFDQSLFYCETCDPRQRSNIITLQLKGINLLLSEYVTCVVGESLILLSFVRLLQTRYFFYLSNIVFKMRQSTEVSKHRIHV